MSCLSHAPQPWRHLAQVVIVEVFNIYVREDCKAAQPGWVSVVVMWSQIDILRGAKLRAPDNNVGRRPASRQSEKTISSKMRDSW